MSANNNNNTKDDDDDNTSLINYLIKQTTRVN